MTVASALASAIALGLDRLDAQLLLLHALGKPASARAWLMAHDRDALLQPVVDGVIKVDDEKHYQLVPSNSISPEDLVTNK